MMSTKEPKVLSHFKRGGDEDEGHSQVSIKAGSSFWFGKFSDDTNLIQRILALVILYRLVKMREQVDRYFRMKCCIKLLARPSWYECYLHSALRIPDIQATRRNSGLLTLQLEKESNTVKSSTRQTWVYGKIIVNKRTEPRAKELRKIWQNLLP